MQIVRESDAGYTRPPTKLKYPCGTIRDVHTHAIKEIKSPCGSTVEMYTFTSANGNYMYIIILDRRKRNSRSSTKIFYDITTIILKHHETLLSNTPNWSKLMKIIPANLIKYMTLPNLKL